MIKGRNLRPHHWEEVLPEALHSVRTLLSTATKTTPHERFLPFPRRSMLGRSLPTWLITPNTVLLKRFVRNKSEPLCDEVELLDATPKTALVPFSDGRESTVSVSDLALLSGNEPRDVSETTTENCTSDTGNSGVRDRAGRLGFEQVDQDPLIVSKNMCLTRWRSGGGSGGGTFRGRHFADQKYILKDFKGFSFSLLLFNKFLKDLKVPSLFNCCV